MSVSCPRNLDLQPKIQGGKVVNEDGFATVAGSTGWVCIEVVTTAPTDTTTW